MCGPVASEVILTDREHRASQPSSRLAKDLPRQGTHLGWLRCEANAAPFDVSGEDCDVAYSGKGCYGPPTDETMVDLPPG